MRPAAAWLILWARGGVSPGCSRPCALACHGIRRAAAASGPQRYRRRRQSSWCGPQFRRSLGLAPCPTRKRCSLCGSRSPASARRGPLRSPPRLRPRSVGDRRPASRSSLGLALSGRPMRGPSRSAHAPPLCVGIRSGRPVVVAALLLRRSVARFALLPPVARPARARVLARALADFGGSAAAKIQRLNFNLHM